MSLSPPPNWANAVLAFWFGELTEEQWWTSTPEIDAAIRTRFADVYAYAAEAEPAQLVETADSAVAAVIALDQFPRNMFRRSARAFATDPKALQVTTLAVARGLDRQMPDSRRHFLYMPFMHAEDLASQNRAVELLTAMAAKDPAEDSGVRSAIEHRALIERFGRFPHRNAVLGRANTPSEDAYLAGGIKRYGQ